MGDIGPARGVLHRHGADFPFRIEIDHRVFIRIGKQNHAWFVWPVDDALVAAYELSYLSL